MADEKPGAAAAPDAAEAAYQKELRERVTGAAAEMGISTEEKKPEEPAKEEGEEPATDEEEGEKPEAEDSEEDGEEAPEEKGKYSAAFRKLQKQEAQLQQFKTTVLQKERQIVEREQRMQQNEQELGAFVKSLKVDPFGTLMKAGLMTAKDAEYASKQLYYHSDAAGADPKNKAEADRLRREHEFYLEQQSTRQQVEALKREREEERAKAAQNQETTAYLAKFDATVETYKNKTPLLAKALEKNPTRTRQELLQIANDLSAAKQAFADPGLVVLAWMKQRKALLAELGIKEPAATTPEQAKSKTAAEKKGPTNGKPAPAQSEPDEAAYQKELRERLNGTYVGD